jgi:hypothetical protein
MKKRNQVRRNGSPAAAAPQSKTHGADGASAQPPEDLLKLVRSQATWNITSGAGEALHRTLDGQLILVDRAPIDTSGHGEYSNARPVSYAEACKWIPTSGNHWKPEVLLHFHGIDPARAAAAEQSKPGQSNAVDKTSQLAGFAGDPAELVPPSAGEVAVVIYDYDRDNNVAEFNLTAAEFARIRDAIAKTVDRPLDREAVTNFVHESLVHPWALTSGEIHIPVQVLVDLAVRKVQDCPIDEQICVWNALSKTLPASAARERARNIGLLQSKVAALQLQFADTLSSQAQEQLAKD